MAPASFTSTKELVSLALGQGPSFFYGWAPAYTLEDLRKRVVQRLTCQASAYNQGNREQVEWLAPRPNQIARVLQDLGYCPLNRRLPEGRRRFWISSKFAELSKHCPQGSDIELLDIDLSQQEPPVASGPLDELALRPFDEPVGEARKSAESAGKPRLDLVPTAAIEAIAEVLTFGAAKYDDNNWCRGARWGRYYAAMLRHLFAWWRGEDQDPETGLSHLAHAGCCLFFLLEYQRNGWGTDDRFLGPDRQPFQKADGASG